MQQFHSGHAPSKEIPRHLQIEREEEHAESSAVL